MTRAVETMTAAVFEGPGEVALANRPVPRVSRPDDVLIEVEACGVCGTDAHILENPPGHPATLGVILGHEFVGLVRDVGSEAMGVRVGERVAVAPNLSCGSCRWCRRGLPNHCDRFTTLGIFADGGLARYALAPARACHPIDPNLPKEIAALAEPVSCVVNGIEQARLLPGEDVAIYGAGPIGLIFLSLFRAAGAGRVALVEPSDVRRSLAKVMGADICLDPTQLNAAAAIRELTGGTGADVVVDAVGSLLGPALDSVRKAGRVLLFGMNANATALVRQFDVTRNELTVLGSYVGSNVFPQAIRILERGVADLAPMISHHVALEELPQTIEDIRAGRAIKAVVDMAG